MCRSRLKIQKRLLTLQWRLAEDRIINAERRKLEDERFGTDVEQEEPEEVLQNGVKKMIFVLKFISKTYGPMARNKLMFEKEMRDAQRRTRKAKKKIQSHFNLVQKTSGSGSALADIAMDAIAANGHGSPREAWGMDFASISKDGRSRAGAGRTASRKGATDLETDGEGQGQESRRSRSRTKSRSKSRSKSRQRAASSGDGDGDFQGVAPDSDPSGPPGAVKGD